MVAIVKEPVQYQVYVQTDYRYFVSTPDSGESPYQYFRDGTTLCFTMLWVWMDDWSVTYMWIQKLPIGMIFREVENRRAQGDTVYDMFRLLSHFPFCPAKPSVPNQVMCRLLPTPQLTPLPGMPGGTRAESP